MNKKEAKAKVKDLLSSGVPRSEVFTQLSGQGIKDSLLASLIASSADPYLYHMHDRKVNAVITLMFIQAALALLIGFSIGSAIGPDARWVVDGLSALSRSCLPGGSTITWPEHTMHTLFYMRVR